MNSRVLRVAFALSLASIAFALTIGCNTTPQVSGKWRGSGRFSSQIPKTAGNTAMQAVADVPLTVTLTLNQANAAVSGDADVAFNGSDIHLPITAGTITKDGSLSIEASKSGFNTLHLSLDGKADANTISGQMDWKMGTILGVAENKGPITLNRGS
jgi:hypothetical protein